MGLSRMWDSPFIYPPWSSCSGLSAWVERGRMKRRQCRYPAVLVINKCRLCTKKGREGMPLFRNRIKGMFELEKREDKIRRLSHELNFFEDLQNFNRHFLYVLRVFKQIFYWRVEKIKYKIFFFALMKLFSYSKNYFTKSLPRP